MERILKWKQERAKLITEARDLVDLAEQEKRDLSAEEEARYQKIFDDSAKLKSKIEREEALLDEERNMARVNNEPVKPNVNEKDPRRARRSSITQRSVRSPPWEDPDVSVHLSRSDPVAGSWWLPRVRPGTDQRRSTTSLYPRACQDFS
jgi:hypothetical protein